MSKRMKILNIINDTNLKYYVKFYAKLISYLASKF